MHSQLCYCFFFFNDTATTEIYTLSLHDALPICVATDRARHLGSVPSMTRHRVLRLLPADTVRSEEHTSELQSQSNLVCRLLLEKKKKINSTKYYLSKIRHWIQSTYSSSQRRPLA